MDKNSIHKSTSALIVLQHYAGVEIVCQSVACVAGAWMEVAGERENGRARGRHARGACLLLARPFFLVPTNCKRLLRRLARALSC